MRVLSVVTLVSPLGEYGGPVRVAVNQARALAELGHEVTLAGAERGYAGSPPREVDGVRAELHPARRLVPGTGFAGLGAPGLWRWLRRHATDFDVVHVHAARDLVTLPAARIAGGRGVPYVLQTHGMIDASTNPLARPLDAALTRPVLRGARRIAYLTPEERGALDDLVPGLPLAELPNGVPELPGSGHDGPLTVLFLARLAPRKRPVQFVETARALGPSFPDVRWRLVGPDEGEGDAVRAAVQSARAAGVDVRWDGPADPAATAAIMAEAALYVLPAVDEPYPMSVLEAMATGLPVVVTDTCGLAPLVTGADAGAVTDGTQAALDAAVRLRLEDPARAWDEGRRGRSWVREQRGMPAIADRLVELYGP